MMSFCSKGLASDELSNLKRVMISSPIVTHCGKADRHVLAQILFPFQIEVWQFAEDDSGPLAHASGDIASDDEWRFTVGFQRGRNTVLPLDAFGNGVFVAAAYMVIVLLAKRCEIVAGPRTRIIVG